MLVLVVNAGSSSIKYQVFSMPEEKQLARGLVDRIQTPEATLDHHADGRDAQQFSLGMLSYEQAFAQILGVLACSTNGVLHDLGEIDVVGHRVAHGADAFRESVQIDQNVIAAIQTYIELAPLHNPPNLMGIRCCMQHLPAVPHIAVFDTAFHQTLPEHAVCYPLPYQLYENHGIRRYGFHGTSFRYVCESLAERLGRSLKGLRVIACHLGSGCSVAAVHYGLSVDTSMGFTPLEGVMMGTRPGDLDPGLPFYLSEKLGLTQQEVLDMLYRESGLAGISGLGSDVRDLEAAALEGHHRAKLAIQVYCYRVKKYVGAYAAVMGGVDALIFTGGVGEGSTKVREAVCSGLGFLGIRLDLERNKRGASARPIHVDSASVATWVIPTNEELMIARDAYQIAQSVGVETNSVGDAKRDFLSV